MIPRLVAALAAAAVLAYALPGDGRDSLRGTLVMLPLVVAGLFELYRWAHRQRLMAELKKAGEAEGGAARSRSGSTRTRPIALLGLRPGLAEGIAVGVLALLALSRTALSPAFGSRTIFAGFVLLLGLQVARLVLLLRPALGGYLPRKIPAQFFFLPLVFYLAILPWSIGQRPADGDEPYFLLVAHSLAHDFDTGLSNNYEAGDSLSFMGREIEPQYGDPVDVSGEQHSRHSPLLPLLLVPAYLVGGRLGAVTVMAILTAALAWMFLKLAARYFPDRPTEALAAWTLLAFSAPIVLYSHQIWAEVPAALLLLVALDRVLDLGGDRESPRTWIALVLTIVLLPLLKLRFALLALPLMALAVGRSKRRMLLLSAVGVAALVGAGLLLSNWLRYGNLLRYRGWKEVALHTFPAENYLRGLIGLFYDCAFGLFAAAPLWLLLLPALVALALTRTSLRLHLPLLTLPMLLFVVPRFEWYGGWSPPFRYGIALLPLLALALVPLLGRRRRWRTSALLAALGALTLVLTVLWIVRPEWTYNLAAGRNHLLDFLGAKLGADVARFFPSMVRPRAATWVWVALSMLTVPWAWERRRLPKRWLDPSPAAGLAVLLTLLALLPLAAHRLPSRAVEIEDPYVTKLGGELYPALWTIARPRFRGGWIVGPGEVISAPVVAGGDRVDLAIDFASPPQEAPLPGLEIRTDDELLATWPGGECRHCTIRFDDLPWSPGKPLVLSATGDEGAALGTMIIHRVRFDWR